VASQNKSRLVSKFPEAKHAGHEAVQYAIAQAVLAGENTANDRIASGNTQRGYDLPITVHQSVAPMFGKITYDEWWGRFFEYGTVKLPAMPFMRPGHRKMRGIFRAVMHKDFEGWIKARASVPKT